ncbi:MAG: hypothetical protein EBZ61_10245, partial [Micrococcales bacterium]|nr:hypothetical protein [Micrococcales bacterium]
LKENQIYWKGDRAEYTGKSEVIYGGLFYEYKLLTGWQEGKKIWSLSKPKNIPCQTASQS